MALLNKGITKLSQLNIDVDKAWQDMQGNPKGIANIRELAANMVKGEMLVRGDSVLERLPAGPDSYVLTSRGTGKIPTWAPAAGQLKYYFPVQLSSSKLAGKVTPNGSVAKAALLSALRIATLTDDIAEMIKLLTPRPTSTKIVEVAPVNQSIALSRAVDSEGGVELLVDGAIADDGGILTDETTAARQSTNNDMTLTPAAPQVNDAYYIGFVRKFNRIWITMGTPGVGNWQNTEEYWNGSTWQALANVADLTSQFMASGLKSTSWTMPVDWQTCAVNGVTLYWMRYRVSAFNNLITQPKGTQAWCEYFV
jgi:hypothetical protein